MKVDELPEGQCDDRPIDTGYAAVRRELRTDAAGLQIVMTES